MTKILRAVGATFAYKRGTSRPHAKFTGDFGNAIEVIRISDRSLLSVFAKNLEPCNFRLLQHNPLNNGHRRSEKCQLLTRAVQHGFQFMPSIGANPRNENKPLDSSPVCVSCYPTLPRSRSNTIEPLRSVHLRTPGSWLCGGRGMPSWLAGNNRAASAIVRFLVD